RLRAETRLGIPALVHEECLTGLAAWKAATFPTPLAWGASFDPALVEEMAVSIGDSMRELGIHQGLAPVLDAVRGPRWGRVEGVAVRVGAARRGRGTQQGLAPVLDVVRGPRGRRVDECIAEDPYVVGVLGTAYVKGLQAAGVHATLKHFVGYSGSRAGRNHA